MTHHPEHRPRKRFGQHFLADGRIADRIVAAAGIGPEDAVLEIGPGRGVLTERLLACAGTVTAVELDRDLIPILRERFGEGPRFRLVEGDILAADIPGLLPPEARFFRVVANLPYYITNPIIEMLLNARAVLADAVLMVQKEVANRLASPPGSKSFGLTTLNLALHADIEQLFIVRPGSFNPPPAVTSAVVRIRFRDRERYPGLDERLFRDLTGEAFRQRRKMVRNTLMPALETRGIADPAAILAESGIDPAARPETVGPDAWVRLTRAASAAGASRGGRP